MSKYIDADKLLQELFIVDEEEWTTPEIRAVLENAPTIITSTKRTGKWVKLNEYRYECPFCHVDFGNFGLPMNFCFNCGAKMKE